MQDKTDNLTNFYCSPHLTEKYDKLKIFKAIQI